MNRKQTRIPTAAELMEAVADFMEQKLLPALQTGDVGKQRFHTRVSLNVIRILQRETACPENADLEAQLAALTQGEGSSEDKRLALAEQIRQGELDENDPELLACLRAYCLERLAVDNPDYSAYLAARKS